MKRGFTLIELLVVVLIIGILAAVALPQYSKAVVKARLTEARLRIGEAQKALNLGFLEGGGVVNLNGSEGAYFTGVNALSLGLDFTSGMSCDWAGACHTPYFTLYVSCNYYGRVCNIGSYLYEERNLKKPLCMLGVEIRASGVLSKTCSWRSNFGKSLCESLVKDGWTVQRLAE